MGLQLLGLSTGFHGLKRSIGQILNSKYCGLGHRSAERIYRVRLFCVSEVDSSTASETDLRNNEKHHHTLAPRLASGVYIFLEVSFFFRFGFLISTAVKVTIKGNILNGAKVQQIGLQRKFTYPDE